MPPLPKGPRDLTLAPVAVEIDLNLQRLRDLTAEELVPELELVLDRPALGGTRNVRAERVRDAAVRNVNLHDWQALVTDDGCRLRLSGGSVTLDLGLSALLLRYIEG